MSLSFEHRPFFPQISKILPHIPTRAKRVKTLTERLLGDELWMESNLGQKAVTGAFLWVEASRVWNSVTAPEHADQYAAIAERIEPLLPEIIPDLVLKNFC